MRKIKRNGVDEMVFIIMGISIVVGLAALFNYEEQRQREAIDNDENFRRK